MKAYLNAFKNYAKFSGRTSRKDFWLFTLINTLVNYALTYLGALVGATISYNIGISPIEYSILAGIYSLIVFIPSLAIMVRRMHDINKSGWMILVSLIPLAGFIWLLVLLCKKGNEGANNYGELAAE